MHHRAGFTLIELSIVLVIIGLIAGGVLVGRDLIKAAEVRATVGQIEKYNSAVNTFRTKYNAIPGDMLPTDAAAFGLYNTPSAGDGNGLIASNGDNGPNAPYGEPLIFWRSLSDANLIDGSFGASLIYGWTAYFGNNVDPSNWFPSAKLGRGNYVVVGSSNGVNYFGITGIPSIFVNSGGWTALSANLTPIEAYSIDIKTDDGMPETGTIQAHGVGQGAGTTLLDDLNTSNEPTVASTATAGKCAVGTDTQTSNTYNRDSSNGGNTPACTMRFQFN